jgi:hypothetical protein
MGDHGKPGTWEDNTAHAGALQHSQRPGDCRTSRRRQVFWLVGFRFSPGPDPLPRCDRVDMDQELPTYSGGSASDSHRLPF